MAFNDEPGQRIRDKVWSCHSYRRGFNSYVSRKREGNLRKATPQEINEHARWKEASAPTMHDHYARPLQHRIRSGIPFGYHPYLRLRSSDQTRFKHYKCLFYPLLT